MKIQAIKKACMDREVFYLFNSRSGRQLLSNGVAAWPVEGITLTADMIPALFDLSEKQVQKLTIHETAVPSEEHYVLEPMAGEEELKDLGLIWDAGTFYRALQSENGVLFIEAEQTKPGENKEGKFVYALRKGEWAIPLVACYGDMLASAFVMPVKTAAFMERIEKICFTPRYEL